MGAWYVFVPVILLVNFRSRTYKIERQVAHHLTDESLCKWLYEATDDTDPDRLQAWQDEARKRIWRNSGKIQP